MITKLEYAKAVYSYGAYLWDNSSKDEFHAARRINGALNNLKTEFRIPMSFKDRDSSNSPSIEKFLQLLETKDQFTLTLDETLVLDSLARILK